LNHYTGIPPIDKPCPEPELALSEEFLQMLIKNFPDGHTFDMTRGKTDTLQEKASDRLADILPDAKSVLFIPLWDWNKACWLAGTLVWTNDHRRPLGIEELHYFKVFGDSIISEVSRVHWNANERSKFDFVSSISHELRSPLHGILGSTELVQSLPLPSPQRDMMKMIERSGLTLLDTIDQL
jgi:signal transduction histidine kinase